MKVNTDGILLGAWADIRGLKKGLDVGTGTGIIALMCAQKSSDCFVTAIDIDDDSVLQATSNVLKSKYANRVEVIKAPLQEHYKNVNYEYDFILSNPPYFVDSTISGDAKLAKARHSIELNHFELVDHCYRLLHHKGSVFLILPSAEADTCIKYALEKGFFVHKFTHVRSIKGSNIIRKLLQLTKEPKQSKVVENTLSIYVDSKLKIYSEEYIQLTKDYYLNF